MPDEEFRPGAHDLETPFIFVPHGAPDPVEWKRQHTGWVSFPATFVPHPRPIPKWKVINGQRWPLDKKGRPWPKTRYGRPTCPFDELPPGMPAPGTQYELLRKLENPMLFFGDEPVPTVAEFSQLAERLRAERAAAAPPPPVQRPKAYDGDGLGPARDYLDAMARVDGQLREFAESARQEKAAAARQQHAAEQDAAPSQSIIAAKTGAPLQVGADAARALVAGGTAAAAGPALSGAVGGGVLGRAAAALLGAAGGPAALLGGVFWPSPTGDGTLSGTGLTLADAPGLEPPTLPDQADPGVSIDPDAGKPTVLATPAVPQAGPDVEGFDQLDGDPATVFERSKLRSNMEDARMIAKGQVAHHIVPGGRPMNGGRDVTQSQKLLEELEIDRDGVNNGVALSPEFHSKIHTKGYYDRINRELARTTSSRDAKQILDQIGFELQDADKVYRQTGLFPSWIR